MFKKVIINFQSKNKMNISYNDVSEIEYVLFILYRTGRILHERIIEKNINEITATIIVIDEYKFLKTFNKLKQIFDHKYEIEISQGEHVSTTTETCTCNKATFYVINPNYDFINNTCTNSLLICGDCGNHVPWISIMDINGDECANVVDFHEMYESLEKLRLKTNYEKLEL